MSSRTPGAAPRRIFIDKQSPRAFRALTQTSEAVHAVAADAGLDRTVMELVNLRVSQMNGCAFCLDTHTKAAIRAGESAQRLGVLAAWRDTEVFTLWNARPWHWPRRRPTRPTPSHRNPPTGPLAMNSRTTRSPR